MLEGLRRRFGLAQFDEKADPAKLARIGDEVRARLAANPRAEDRGGAKADLFLVPDMLSPDQCKRLIKAIDSRITRSTLFSDRVAPAGRTSSTHYFRKDLPETRAATAAIDATLGIERRHGETLQGQRYLVGQEYRHHCDFFRQDRPYWPGERPRGGQRTWTAMIYLNEVEEGGQTEFPTLGLVATPRPGLMVAWNNMDRKGRPNRATRHAALPVLAGSKYVVTQWYRQEDWQVSRS
ncbi:prolyl hydroxylase family protein [Qipengyuania sp. RANM35]|uniref:prolyl hydroxylase family protein n=1 Tax=Qipengyuania sp. RANM35 TaxID=3068635 RepID=UPI0034DB6548